MNKALWKLAGICLAVIFASGCIGPKYIPSSYFLNRHDMRLRVKPIPAPIHIEESNNSDDGLIGGIVRAAAQSSRAGDMKKVFAHIDNEEVRNGLESSITEKIKQNYNVKNDAQDLAVDVEITSWGWVLPTSSFGIRVGSYQLQMSGKVIVYDESMGRKEIGHIFLTTKEEMKDNMSEAETSRRVKRAVDEFAELCSEYLWRSDGK